MKAIVSIEIECGKTTCKPCEFVGLLESCILFVDENGRHLPLKRTRSRQGNDFERRALCLAGGVKAEGK